MQLSPVISTEDSESDSSTTSSGSSSSSSSSSLVSPRYNMKSETEDEKVPEMDEKAKQNHDEELMVSRVCHNEAHGGYML